jgi:hypothetical protein
MHIHVQQDCALAKFWLSPVAYARSTGFSARELAKLLELVREHREIFKGAWDEFFSS